MIIESKQQQRFIPSGADNPESLIAVLDKRIESIVRSAEASTVWQELTDPVTDSEMVLAILREMHLEIVSYQADLTDAMICTIAQFPRTMPEKMIRSMLLHQSEEFDHGEMALRSFVALGGSELEARTHKRSPAAFALAGMWRMLAHERDPFAYLGPIYVFEGMTPILASHLMDALRDRGIPTAAMEFVDVHAEADIRHINLLRKLVMDIAKMHPESVESMKYGADCLEQVYPLPVWEAARRRAHERARAKEVASV